MVLVLGDRATRSQNADQEHGKQKRFDRLPWRESG